LVGKDTCQKPVVPIPENVSIPIFCAFCHGAVELQYEESREPQDSAYRCPYCAVENSLSIPGRMLWVTERDATKDITEKPTKQ
jgi:hypothetical protein